MADHGNGERTSDCAEPDVRRRSLLRRVGAGVAVVAGASIAGCSGGDGSSDGDDGSSDSDDGEGTAAGDGGSDEQTSGGGDTSGSGGGSNGADDGGSSDGGGTPDVDSPELQAEVDSWAEFGFSASDAEGDVTNEVDGLAVAESVTMTGTDTAGTARFAVFLAMENAGEEHTAPHRYGYHLSAFDGGDQLLTDDSRQTSDSPTLAPGDVAALKVDVGFVDADDGGSAPDDVARYELTIDCTTAGGANPAADGTYCG